MTSASVRESRLLDVLVGPTRRLLATTILAVAVLGIGAGVWAWSGAPPASGSADSNPTTAGAAAEDSELPPGWTNAVEECDCLFGGQ